MQPTEEHRAISRPIVTDTRSDKTFYKTLTEAYFAEQAVHQYLYDKGLMVTQAGFGFRDFRSNAKKFVDTADLTVGHEHTIDVKIKRCLDEDSNFPNKQIPIVESYKQPCDSYILVEWDFDTRTIKRMRALPKEGLSGEYTKTNHRGTKTYATAKYKYLRPIGNLIRYLHAQGYGFAEYLVN